MKYLEEYENEIMNAFEILTCTVQDTNKLGMMCKQEVLYALNEYFDMIERRED